MGEITKLVATGVIGCLVGSLGTFSAVQHTSSRADALLLEDPANKPAGSPDSPLRPPSNMAIASEGGDAGGLVEPDNPCACADEKAPRRQRARLNPNASPTRQERFALERTFAELMEESKFDEALLLLTEKWRTLDLRSEDRDDRSLRWAVIRMLNQLGEEDFRAAAFLNAITQDATARFIASGDPKDFALGLELAGRTNNGAALLELYRQADIEELQNYRRAVWSHFSDMAQEPDADFLLDVIPNIPTMSNRWVRIVRQDADHNLQRARADGTDRVSQSWWQGATKHADAFDNMAFAYDRRGEHDKAQQMRDNVAKMREQLQRFDAL